MATENSKKRRIMIITGDESIIDQIQHGNHSSLIKSFVIDSTDKLTEKYQLPSSVSAAIEVPTSNAKKTKVGTLTCVVCGASALGYNFDAITCESCKAFFRRNALKNLSTFQCRRQGGCEITVETRRRCSACRLTKCLQSGMKRERLLTAEEKAVRRQKIEANREFTLKQQNDFDFDKNESFEFESSLLDELVSLDESNLLCLTDFDNLFPATPVQAERERTLLSSEDIQRVETIQNSYNNRIELAARDGLPWNPSIHATTFLQHINERSVTAVRLLSFFKQIPEFNQLNVNDRVTLIKYNLMPLCILNSTLSYNKETDQVKEAECDVPFNASVLQSIHGEELYLQIKRIFESFARIALHDQRIIQLALIALILTKGFSTDTDMNEPMLNDGMAVYRAQSHYTELLWKYMEAVHGFEKATKIFNELIGQFMLWQKIHRQLRLSTEKNLATVDKNELLPIMKSLLCIN